MNTPFNADEFVRSMSDEITTQINKAILHQVAVQPMTPLMNLEDITGEVIKDFLRSKHTATWSIFSIGSEDSLEKATEWFKRELNMLYAFTYRSDEYAALLDNKTPLIRSRS